MLSTTSPPSERRTKEMQVPKILIELDTDTQCVVPTYHPRYRIEYWTGGYWAPLGSDDFLVPPQPEHVRAEPVEAQPVAWLYEYDGTRGASAERLTLGIGVVSWATETPLYAAPQPPDWSNPPASIMKRLAEQVGAQEPSQEPVADFVTINGVRTIQTRIPLHLVADGPLYAAPQPQASPQAPNAQDK